MTDESRDKSAEAAPKKEGWLRPLSIAAIPAAVSLVAALSSYQSASTARVQADRLERFKLEREGQFKVYERVEGQLSSGQPYNLVIASAYVQLIEDVAIRRALCETIGSIAFAQLAGNSASSDRDRIVAALRDVARVARDCSEAMEVGRPALATSGDARATVQAIADAPPITATAVQDRGAEQAPVTAVVSGATASPTGWDVDVFWCRSQSEPSLALARRTAVQLAAVSNANRTLGGHQLGRIRLRAVSAEAQARLAPVPGNRIFGTADEQVFADAVAAELNARIPNSGFRYSRANGITRWYVSIFTCGFGR